MRFVLVLTVAAIACKTSPAQMPHEPEPPPSPFAALTAELATPAQGIWATIPPPLADDVKKGAPAAADPKMALAAAQNRLAGWKLETDGVRPEDIGARFRSALEAVYLAEPLAYGGKDAAAAALLHHLYDQLDAQTFRDWLKTAPNIGVDRKLLEILADAAPAQRKHLAAQVLAAGSPPDAVDSVLRALAERARSDGDAAKAQKLFALVVQRRGAAATLDDWIDLSNADGRIDDLAGAQAALANAKQLPAPDRFAQAKVRDAGHDVASLQRYLAIKASPELAAKLEKLDLLRTLGRIPEAQAVLTELKAQAPNDARVRVRSAAMGFEGMALAGNMLEAAGFVTQELGDDNLTNKDPDYWSMLIGAQGAHAMGEALPLLFQDKVAGGRKMIEILKTMRTMSEQLEKERPGRAAALQFVLDRAMPIIEKSDKQDVAVADLLAGGLDAAVALRAKYPDTADLDRLVFTFATFTKDRQKALAAVTAKPGTAPDDDIDLYLARARSALTIAIVIATPAAVESARAAITDIAPTWSPQVEANREAMLGDCDAIEATLAKDAAKWTSAAAHYETARTLHKEVRARATNNLGWIKLQQGDAQGADALFRESGEDESSGRRWTAYLNALATPHRAAERLEGLRTLILSNAGNDGKPPGTLLVWLAATATDPKEAGDAAQKALAELADPFTAIKPYNPALGFETEGAFQVGIGLASRKLYELNTTAYASLWLMPPLPLDPAALAAKAPKPAKKPKK